MPTTESQALRLLITTDQVACTRECRRGWPDIWHSPECTWQPTVEAVYALERADEANG